MTATVRLLALLLTVALLERSLVAGSAINSQTLNKASHDETLQQPVGEGIDHNENSSTHLDLYHNTRYKVFSFDFLSVQAAYVVSLWIFFASVAKIGFHMNNKLSSLFPESCLLIILGILVGIVVYFATSQKSRTEASLNAATFFEFLLPPIILDAGYFMPNRAFFNNIGSILLYAVVGTLWNTASIGLTLWGASQMGWLGTDIHLLHCLVFSSLISAVDPVAVLAVFEEIHVNEQLHIVVFGESLLNDAVTVVLYHMFMEYSLQSQVLYMDILAGVAQFFIVGIGGVIIGVLFGYLCAFITRFTAHVRVIEPIFVFLLAYLSYLTAEMFHWSGIMALTFCGIIMKQYAVHNISEKSQTTIKYFLKMLSSITETVIFMMLGTSTVEDTHVWDVVFVVITLLSCLIYRAIGVLGLTWLVNKKRVSKLSMVDQFVMAYGGLRGAIAFALAILLSDDFFPDKHLFVTTTIVVVMFTVFVQGITIKPLVNALKVKKSSKSELMMNIQINERMMDHTMAAIEDITGYHGNNWLRDKWEYYNSKYIEKWVLREKHKTKERGILRVYSKLSLKDAVEAANTGHHSSVLQMNGNQSLLRMIKNYSVTSFGESTGAEHDAYKLPVNDTVVDMQALEAHYSKKIADDTISHHLLKSNLIVPGRKMLPKPGRHTLHDERRDSLQHNLQYLHLRHVISKHSHIQEERKKQRVEEKSRHPGIHKNVSFAAQLDDTPKKLSLAKSAYEKAIEELEDDEDDGMITFNASERDQDDAVSDRSAPSSLVALECMLPWKRDSISYECDPISSREQHMLPDDNHPTTLPAPPWLDNPDYNNIPHSSLRSENQSSERYVSETSAPDRAKDSNLDNCFQSPRSILRDAPKSITVSEGFTNEAFDWESSQSQSFEELVIQAQETHSEDDSEEEVPVQQFGNLKYNRSVTCMDKHGEANEGYDNLSDTCEISPPSSGSPGSQGSADTTTQSGVKFF